MLEGFQPTVLRVFGGLCTFIDRIALALGLSPDCRNARFAPGVVASRDGYGVVLTDGGDFFTGVSQLIKADGDKHLITLSYRGRLTDEYPQGTLTRLADRIAANARMVSASLFSQQYMAFTDGKLGLSPLHRFDGTRLSIVGAGAPGKAPVLDESATAGTGLEPGVHSCAVVFVNKSGDISGWSPVTSFTMVGGLKPRVVVPLGPPDTVQRIIAITPRNDARTFLYTAKMIINENTTATAITLDITEEELVNSQLSITRWVSSFVPWLPAACAQYQERLLVWGSRAVLQPGVEFDPAVSTTTLQNIGLRNLAFDGGFAANLPHGWTAAAAPAGDGLQVGGVAGTPFYGKCLRIGGDNVSLVRGKISQSFRNNANYMRPQVRYGVAAFMRSPYFSPGNLCVDIKSAGGTVLFEARFPLGTDEDDRWVSATHEMSSVMTANETTMSVDVYWEGATPLASSDFLDFKLAIYDADDTQYAHTFFVSDSGRPGTFVGETGVVSVGPDDGEGIRSIFRLRDVLFVAKERALYSVSSTTAGEPVTWGTSLQDPLGGTPSMWGVAADDQSAIIAGRDAAMRFDGATSTPVSREIEALWRSADWSRGERAIVVVDRAKEIVRFALPKTTDVEGSSLILTLDYKEGWGSPVPGGSGTKWCVDSFIGTTGSADVNSAAITAGARVLMPSGTHSTVLSIYGQLVANLMDPEDLSSPTWTFGAVAPTVTTGVSDGRGGTLGTRWAFAGGGAVASVGFPPDAGTPVFSLRIKPSIDVTLVTTQDLGISTSHSLTAGVWQRVVVVMGAGASVIALNLGSDAISVDVAAFQVSYDVNGGDWGFAGTNFGEGNEARCGLLVAPVEGLRRDFAGSIRFLYETATFGEEVGRSTFDRCIVRAIGNGYLNATYKGTGTRSWAMTPVQLATDPDEDIEFGADLKAPAASLILSNTSVDGWAVVKRVAVATSGQRTGWLRGRNG